MEITKEVQDKADTFFEQYRSFTKHIREHLPETKGEDALSAFLIYKLAELELNIENLIAKSHTLDKK